MEQKQGNVAVTKQQDSISSSIINVKSILIVMGLVLIFILSYYLF